MKETNQALSVSPLSGIAYPIPKTTDDREAIESFLSANKHKNVVVVQGLGFVGAVMAMVCANAHGEDYAVIGVDLATPEAWWRICSLNDGTFPLSSNDEEVEQLFNSAIKSHSFLATHDPYAYSNADVVVVDVNLDVKKKVDNCGLLDGYDVDLTGFRRAIATIGDHCRENVVVLVETTVPPGTCQNVVYPCLMERLLARGLTTAHLKLGHSYERVMPGPNYVDSIRKFPRVYSGIDSASADATEAFLRTIINTEQCALTRLSSTNASEMAKVMENSYRAMNIAFVVEWTRFAEEAGVDLFSVVNAIRQRPTHANLMHPGIGVGGYCLTKDPLLASWAKKAFFGADSPLECSVNAVRVNDQMPSYAYAFLRTHTGDLLGKKVLLMGVSYRGDVGDTRFSPVSAFYDHLFSAGSCVLLHDPFVSHWQEKGTGVSPNLNDQLAAEPDVIVLSSMHSIYRDESTIQLLEAATPALVFDSLGLLNAEQIERLQNRHIVKVLGRGDL
jgi:UDP-N-acetyl-D-glucosamine dehydrogenase